MLPTPRKGESKDDESGCWFLVDDVESARTGSDDSDVRGSDRSRVRDVDVRAAMVLLGAGAWAIGGLR